MSMDIHVTASKAGFRLAITETIERNVSHRCVDLEVAAVYSDRS